MSDLLSELLQSRDYLLADGATGTNFFAMGLESGEAPDVWNIDHPERVHALHQGFVEAGSDIILTNTFGANRYRLMLHGDQDRVQQINESGARIARMEADAVARPVVVAGSMGPTGEIYQPVGPLSIEDGEAAFAEQAKALADGGVDVLWIETISGIDEITAAVRGAAQVGLPVVATMTFDTAGCTMMGITPEQAVDHAHGLDTRLVAFGANCGIGPGTLVDTVLGLGRRAQADDILIAKGNCGIPEYKDGEIVYSGSHHVMAAYARLARDAGARIIGGCCGTTPAHVKAMADALQGYIPVAQPQRQKIEAALGPITAKAPKLSEGQEDNGRRRGRRRNG